MPTYYLDLEGGSDAADGTTFANRWKTFTGGPTAARIAPGDTIRMMAARRSALGTCSWTKGSNTVTLPGALTAVIASCDTSWTASALVTATGATWNAYKEGSYCNSLAVSGSFTTGKIAYFDLGSNQDFSAYQQVSFYFSLTTTKSAGTFKLRLCSDTTGDTVVNSFTIPAVNSNACHKFTIDYGGNLGASIRSVSLEIAIDLATSSTRYVYIDHIIACKNKTASDCLTLSHIIKKSGTTNWYAIRSIVGTTLTLETYNPTTPGSGLPNGYGFAGSTESAAGIAIMPYVEPANLADAVQDAGTDGSRITFSGGYNRTDMSTIDNADDFTARAFSTGQGNAIVTVNQAFITFKKMIGTCNGGPLFQSSSVTSIYENCHAILTTGLAQGPQAQLIDCTITTATNTAQLPSIMRDSTVRGESFNSTYSYGMSVASARRSSITCVGSQGAGVHFVAGYCDLDYLEIADAANGAWVRGSGDFRCRAGSIVTSGSGFYTDSSLMPINANADGLTITCTSDTNIASTIGTERKGSRIAISNFEAAGVHKTFLGVGVIDSDASVRHTASGISWKLQPTSTLASAVRPVSLVICKVLCIANEEVTVSAWFYRTNAGASGRLFLQGGQILGVSADVTDDMTVTSDWEQLSVVFTPTETGMVEIEALAWGGTTYAVYVDDVTRTVTP